MIQRTNKIFIGKDINRTAAVVDGMSPMTTSSAGYLFSLVEGEIVILDKYKKVLGAGKTIADTDVIYICQGMGTTYDTQNEAASAMSTVRRVRLSDPIQGAKVKSYTGQSYAAASQQITNLTVTGITVVKGTEYLIRVVYKDIWEHPGQFTATYRWIATDATLTTMTAQAIAKVNAHAGRRVQATESSATIITLTGKAIPSCTTGLNDLDPFTMVEFDAFLDYVSAVSSGYGGYWTTFGAVKATTKASYGVGMWEHVRDIERAAWSYLGITNRTHYPIILPDACTVVGATYDIITIEHDAAYLSPDNQYVKQAPLTTQIAFVVPSSGTQETVVLGTLNTWLASCPGAFAPVSV
jgi:hypothetical protein